MEPNSSEYQNPRSYSLSVKQFETQPVQLERYVFPQRVNRANFISFYIQSFTISRGIIEIQADWMRFIKNKTGFDPLKTLKHFDAAGNLQALTPEERKIMEDAFNNVKKHQKEDGTASLGGEFYDDQFQVTLYELQTKKRLSFDLENLSPEEFLAKLREKAAGS